jgi:glycosyltransferase involved in cell wall biosynthesis
MHDQQNPLKIAVDARSLNREYLRGIGRYLYEIISRSVKYNGCIEWLLYADREDLPFHLPPIANARINFFTFRGDRFHFWEQIGLPSRAKKDNADLLHCPGSRAPWWQPLKTIVTIHDTIPWRMNEPNWQRGFYTDNILPRAYRKSKAIITVSLNSKNDIMRQWNFADSDVSVIYNGIDDMYFLDNDNHLPSGFHNKKYIVYFGGLIPRKRLDWAIRILTCIKDQNIDLLICGVEAINHHTVRSRLPPDIQNRVRILDFIPENQMPSLYRHALLVLYPTLYEGFGLPALEAQASGTPVLFSKVGSLSELAGPIAHLLPETDFDAWVASCNSIISQRFQRPEPNVESRIWAKQFSWDTAARNTLILYSDLLGG